MHWSIAESGKLYALKGNHVEALCRYREALRLAVSSKAPEVFFRHYTQCALESLELTGAYDEIIRFCTDADRHYETLALGSSLHHRDHGSVLERLGLVQLKNGNLKAGREALQQALKIAGKGSLPASEEVLGWLGRGFTVEAPRILQSQRRHKYFVVRPDQVDSQRAKTVSPELQAVLRDPSKGMAG
jgi:tetratricopeptide (TPR) repeat protein